MCVLIPVILAREHSLEATDGSSLGGVNGAQLVELDVARASETEQADVSNIPEPAPEKKRGRGRLGKASQEGATNKKLGELNSLLQKAAAYSTFLRERLLQSQKEAQASRSNHTSGPPSNSTTAMRDPRQPKLVINVPERVSVGCRVLRQQISETGARSSGISTLHAYIIVILEDMK